MLECQRKTLVNGSQNLIEATAAPKHLKIVESDTKVIKSSIRDSKIRVPSIVFDSKDKYAASIFGKIGVLEMVLDMTEMCEAAVDSGMMELPSADTDQCYFFADLDSPLCQERFR